MMGLTDKMMTGLIEDWLLFWLTPFSHKRQMVAETVHITRSEIIAAGLHTAKFLVGNKKEWGVINTA